MSAYIAQAQSVHWNTLPYDLDLCRRVLGPIGTDACSNSGSVVDATHEYTVENNGLVWPWFGTFFCNPPFGALVPLFFHRALSEMEAGRATGGIFLVPGRIDTRWFHAFAMQADAIAIVRGRRKFRHIDSEEASEASAPFPVIFIYYGPDKKRFCQVFEDEIHRKDGESEGVVFCPSRKQRLKARRYRHKLRLMTEKVDTELEANIQFAKSLQGFVSGIVKDAVDEAVGKALATGSKKKKTAKKTTTKTKAKKAAKKTTAKTKAKKAPKKAAKKAPKKAPKKAAKKAAKKAPKKKGPKTSVKVGVPRSTSPAEMAKKLLKVLKAHCKKVPPTLPADPGDLAAVEGYSVDMVTIRAQLGIDPTDSAAQQQLRRQLGKFDFIGHVGSTRARRYYLTKAV